MTDHIAALIGLDPDTAAGANAVQDELLPMVHRYRAAWQSARRRAAQDRAENAQIEGLQNGVHNYEQWLAEECRRTEALRAQVARIRTFLEDMAGWCSPHGVAADYARRGLDALDGVDPLGLAGPTREELAKVAPRRFMAGDFLRAPKTGETPTLSREFDADMELPELTAEDAVEAMQDMATDLYKAEDRLAFVREMCDLADRDGKAITTEQVRAWTQYTGCGGVLRLPDEVMPLLRDFAASKGVAGPATRASGTECTCAPPGMSAEWHLGFCARRKGQP